MSKTELPSQSILQSLFTYDTQTGIFRWKSKPNRRIQIGDIVGYKDNNGYIIITIERKLYKAHRIGWKYHYGSNPEYFIDHINGIRSDNRIGNLREASRVENGRNRIMQTNNTSGFKGVSYNKKSSKWISQVKINGATKYLGYFDTPEEASTVYIKFTKSYFKDFYKEIS